LKPSPAIWIDAQLSPAIATWLATILELPACSLREVGLRDADDALIFQRARLAEAIILSKDADFLLLLDRHGPPPRVIWLTCGNTTNAHLREVIQGHAADLRRWLTETTPLIEIGHR
jgi:predicted nuclease of predicted toxin-antitoxin system